MNKEAWVCPKCNIGVAPHCDVCPHCENNLNLQGIPIKIDPTLPPDTWRLEPYKKNPLDPPWTVSSGSSNIEIMISGIRPPKGSQ